MQAYRTSLAIELVEAAGLDALLALLLENFFFVFEVHLSRALPPFRS